ncbi:unnamed protein product, partial [Rhizoctonia solani]
MSGPSSSGLSFSTANPSAISIPSDAAGIVTSLNKIKAVLVAMNHNLGLAINQINANSSDIATAGANHNALDHDVQNIENAIVGLTAQIATLLGGGGSRRKLKLQEPSKFDGMDKTKAMAFRTLITHYIRVVDPSSLADEQIAFIISYLDGAAKTWLEPFEERDLDPSTPVP